MLFLFALFIVIKDFIALFFLCDFFELLFLEIDCLEGSYNTLSASFNFLNDSDCSLHVSIKSSSFLDDLLFWQCGFLEIEEELFYNLISLFFLWVFIVFEVARNGHFDFGGPDSHFKEEFIQVDVLGPD